LDLRRLIVDFQPHAVDSRNPFFQTPPASCTSLAAVELKIGEFEPERLGKMQFCLEALDRDVEKADENPSVGLILCTKKDSAAASPRLWSAKTSRQRRRNDCCEGGFGRAHPPCGGGRRPQRTCVMTNREANS
jgi:hypothetical protein